MEFGFTEQQEKLRKELHDFWANELPEDLDGHLPPLSKELQNFWLDVQRKAGEKGYFAPGYSSELGGMGLSEIELGIANEVQEGYWLIQWPNMIGLHICLPGINLFGTEEQKRRFMPDLTNGKSIWYECFTEPEAGTDEANQQTRAVRDGEDYIINGQKIYISGAYKGNWMYVEARTADTTPKHRGLSLFVIPADAPGVTWEAMPSLGGMQQHIIYFSDVRVSKDAMVGQENRGFYHVMQTFEFERADTAMAAARKRYLREFVQFCRDEKRNGVPLIKDREVRKKLAQMAIDVEVMRLAGWRTVWRFSERERLGPLDYDLTGFFGRVSGFLHPEWMMDILGPYGHLKQGSKYAKMAGWVERWWQATRSQHYAGTTEALKLVLAGRVLGLPRIPAKLNTTIAQALQGS